MTHVFEGIVLPSGLREEVRIGLGTGETRIPGRYAVRGMVDSHCHLTLDRRKGFPYLDADNAEARLAGFARDGITVVRDMGGDRQVTLRLARSQETGLPTVLAAGRFLAPTGRYFPGVYEPTKLEDLASAVAAEVEAGATWVKIIADFPLLVDGAAVRLAEASYTKEALEHAVDVAHHHGARVAAHCTTTLASDLVQIGVDSIEHGDELTLGDLDALGARGGAWTPTLSATLANPRFTSAEQKALGARMAAALPRACAAGVTVLAGSDITGSVSAEIRLLHRFGMSINQALAAGSHSASEYLGTENRDSLVTFPADPRSYPACLSRPRAVIIRGVRIR